VAVTIFYSAIFISENAENYTFPKKSIFLHLQQKIITYPLAKLNWLDGSQTWQNFTYLCTRMRSFSLQQMKKQNKKQNKKRYSLLSIVMSNKFSLSYYHWAGEWRIP
jgi:hypothetical protein